MKIKIIDNWDFALDMTELVNKQNNLIDKIMPVELYFGDYNYVAIENNKPMGVIKVEILNWYSCQVKYLSVFPKYQGEGIGKALLKFALDKKIRSLYFASIYKINTPSISLFYSLGFNRVAEITPKENLYLKEMK